MSTDDSSLEAIKKIVASELSIPYAEVSPALGLYRHPRWDSLTHVSILVRLESEYGLTLTDNIVEELTTVQQMADKIRGRL